MQDTNNSKLINIIFMIYLLIILLYTIGFTYLYKGDLRLLSSNELGDFFAGVFAPLAFFYLFLGYRQQSKVIERNKIDTNLQLDILKKQFQSQQKITFINAQPYFHLRNIKINKIKVQGKPVNLEINFEIINSRALCRSLFFLQNIDGDNYILDGTSLPILEDNIDKIYTIKLLIPYSKLFIDDPEVDTINLMFNYSDTYDDLRVQSIKLFIKNNPIDGEYFDSYQWQREINFFEYF